MKIYIYLSVAIILITVLCVFSVVYINGTTTDVENSLRELTASVEAGDWSKAEAIYQESENNWDKKNDLLHVFVEHCDLEEINVTYKRLGYQLTCRDLYETQISLVELKHYLDHLKENQEFLLGNIF